ncbi:twin-arginine translocase TatA/TatE family subunit [Rhodomicrobium vannielii ATCC 17100]|uniref:Sec-independent protein translocase protein TatA n=1 Tax=Rhodomicrobium udaipurense TaxID=1202716 RepID=A0A8I1GFJ1_9HYPH|nr:MULTISPECIES: twin-arginine translocase TatA/TatE family subunit [Rhodomicrobium]KAI93900.1 preprotein translocase subunit TatA [Rhodomicrobium udaipurense JA643]MBJ7534540.1 twin-arginine translocase TatA/TatE family subunit [Rhodomicrobium vannielii ATCC 17100]MBJ7544114.1 twin-arginine translocase TatA/TatE family subunit [Rhodomicrobium udaipurense]
MFGATWSLPQLLIVLLLVVLLFGRGKISELMGDVAKGIKSFKKGMSEEEATPPPAATQSTAAPAAPKPIEHEAPRAEVKSPVGSETKA